MARIRTIKPEFFDHEYLARVVAEPVRSRTARLLFQGLWTHADREGRLQDRPARLKARIFPYDTDVSEDETNALLQALHDDGFVVRYEVGGRRYLQVVNFLRHQLPSRDEPPSEIPAPDGRLTEYDRAPNATIRARIYARDHYACRYCDRDLSGSPRARCVDHVVPYTQRGTNREANLATACKPCNQRKGNRTPAEAGMRWPEGLGERYTDPVQGEDVPPVPQAVLPPTPPVPPVNPPLTAVRPPVNGGSETADPPSTGGSETADPPSTGLRQGKGIGNREKGSGAVAPDARARGAPGPLAPVASGPHPSHAFCGRVCVPAVLHQELRRKLGGDEAAADTKLRAWYRQVDDGLGQEPIGENDFAFWRTRYERWIGSVGRPRAAPAATDSTWGRILQELRRELSPQDVATWFEPCRICEERIDPRVDGGNELVIEAPAKAIARIQKQYAPALKVACDRILRGLTIEFIAVEAA